MKKYNKLVLGILFDAVGFISFIMPGIGEFIDMIWAPISAWLMLKLYKGKTGKIAAILSFVEEALPFTDVIPTFTVMWCYTYVFKSKVLNKLEDIT